ncbi:hypothetical protein Ahy_A10g050551 [Arachis hypogaea]|uniref:Uncharacterized protein n=1 Tax=Arachis hypogaea TaxID=3818 RepID=A0A445B9P0_ARAHY|nr:hypothetical protein Ahy_A10g050551 [Arachis hypogaea]
MSLTNGNILSSGKPTELVTPFSKRTDRFAVKFSINTVPDIENEIQVPNHEIDEDDVIRKMNVIENRIRKHTRSLVASGLYGEPTDPTIASQVNLMHLTILLMHLQNISRQNVLCSRPLQSFGSCYLIV